MDIVTFIIIAIVVCIIVRCFMPEDTDNSRIAKKDLSPEELVEFVKYGVERILREQRICSKRVDYYNGTDWGPFHFDSYNDNHIEIVDEEDKYLILWKKEGKYFEISQQAPFVKILGKVETFGKRTDKVIKETLNILKLNLEM